MGTLKNNESPRPQEKISSYAVSHALIMGHKCKQRVRKREMKDDIPQQSMPVASYLGSSLSQPQLQALSKRKVSSLLLNLNLMSVGLKTLPKSQASCLPLMLLLIALYLCSDIDPLSCVLGKKLKICI